MIRRAAVLTRRHWYRTCCAAMAAINLLLALALLTDGLRP